MPTQTHHDQPQQPGQGDGTEHGTEHGTAAPAAGVARRSVLRGAAGLGAVGLAAAAGAGAVVAATRPSNAAPRAAAAATPAAAGGDPLVVYLRDASTGEFEVFRGTQQVRVRNPRLVAQLLDGIATAQ
jgi:hypothetical protein